MAHELIVSCSQKQDHCKQKIIIKNTLMLSCKREKDGEHTPNKITPFENVLLLESTNFSYYYDYLYITLVSMVILLDTTNFGNMSARSIRASENTLKR